MLVWGFENDVKKWKRGIRCKFEKGEEKRRGAVSCCWLQPVMFGAICSHVVNL